MFKLSTARTVISLGAMSLVMFCSMSASAMTLDEAVHQTMATHPDILRGKANVEASYSDIKQAKGGLYPSLDVEGGAGRERSDNPATRAVGRGARTFSRTESEFVASQLLFDGGNVIGQIKERQALFGASRFQLEETKQILAFAAVEAFLNVKRSRRLVTIAQQNVNTHKTILKKITKRFVAGAGRKSEVELAESRLAQTKAQLEREQGNLNNANDTFIQVIGSPPPRLLAMPILPSQQPHDLSSAQVLANQINPSINAAESQYHATQESIGVAKSGYFPTITFDVSASYDNNLDGVRGHNNDNQAIVRLTYNLFRGGSDKAAVDAAVARKMEALHEEQNTRRDVNRNVAVAWNDLQAARNRIPFLRTHAHKSLKVSEAYKKQFVLGQRTLFDLLNSESEHFNAKADYVSGQYDVKIAVYQLLASMGSLVSIISYQSRLPVAHEVTDISNKHFYNKKKAHVAPGRASAKTKASPQQNSIAALLLPSLGASQQPANTQAPLLAQQSANPQVPLQVASAGAYASQAKAKKHQHFLAISKSSLKTDGNRYTIRLLAAHKEKTVKEFIAKNKLGKKATYVHFTDKKGNWYVLLYGDYPNKKQAQLAINHLPTHLKRLKPYATSVKSISQGITNTALS